VASFISTGDWSYQNSQQTTGAHVLFELWFTVGFFVDLFVIFLMSVLFDLLFLIIPLVSSNFYWHLLSERTSSILGIGELKDPVGIFSILNKELLHSICFFQMKAQFSEKRSTVDIHKKDDCLLEDTSTKYNKYVVNKKKTSSLFLWFSVSGKV
jgi:hypothetical protein